MDLIDQSWLFKIATSVESNPHPELCAYLEEWEQIAGLLDDQSAAELSRRFHRTLPNKAAVWRVEYADAFLEVVSELLAYGWLKESKGCRQVGFIAEGAARRPDLLGDNKVVVEVKHFRTSNQDRLYYAQHQGEVRTVSNGSPQSLVAKIAKTFREDVLPKFDAYPAPDFDRHMFADISPDTELWGPIEGEWPGTIDSIVGAIAELAAKFDVSIKAIELHSLHRSLGERVHVT